MSGKKVTTGDRVEQVLARVGALLEKGDAAEALRLLAGVREADGHITNARGVCLLRLGRPGDAVALYRELVLTGISLRRDIPLAWITNYATALLLSGNPIGCNGVLRELRRADAPSVRRLREAIGRWEKQMTFWSRLRWRFYGEADSVPTIDFAPGELSLGDSREQDPRAA